jgi:isopenicillin N synthase-like dioxygenase
MDVPTIDFRSSMAGAALAAGLHEIGAVVLVGHPIPRALVNEILAEWAAFFDSPARDRYRFTPHDQDGYFPSPPDPRAARQGGRDLKEFFHLYPWGQVPVEVSDAALRYRSLASALGARLLSWIDDFTPPDVRRVFPMPLPRMLEGADGNTLLRIIRYPPARETSLRSGEHCDTNLLTLVPATTDAGLQVRTSDGKWSDVPAHPGALAVLDGVMLEMLSRGHYPSALHRVVAPGGSSTPARMALPLFLHPADHVVLDGQRTAVEFLRDRTHGRADHETRAYRL